MKDGNDDNSTDKLHIPHIGLLQWFSIDEAKVITSQNDKNERSFGIRFFLEDLRAITNYSHVKTDKDLSLAINNINIWFEKNEENFLKSILVELSSNDAIAAFKEASEFIFSILSVLCFFYRRPFRVGQIRIMDSKHNAILETRKFCSKVENLILPKASFQNTPIGALFSIYREGMNGVDIPYRYICFFKIYEAWFSRAEKFFDREKSDLPKITITKELLAGSYREGFHKNFLDKELGDEEVYKSLKQIRHYLVHPIIDQDKKISPAFVNLDQIQALEFIEGLSNLVERIATKILNYELKNIAKKDLEIENLLNIYYNN